MQPTTEFYISHPIRLPRLSDINLLPILLPQPPFRHLRSNSRARAATHYARGVVWEHARSHCCAGYHNSDGTGTGSLPSRYNQPGYLTPPTSKSVCHEHIWPCVWYEPVYTNDISGFPVVTFCDQIWMKKNLDVTTFNRNATPTPGDGTIHNG